MIEERPILNDLMFKINDGKVKTYGFLIMTD